MHTTIRTLSCVLAGKLPSGLSDSEGVALALCCINQVKIAFDLDCRYDRFVVNHELWVPVTRNYSSLITPINDALTRLTPIRVADRLGHSTAGAYAGVFAEVVSMWLQRFMSTSIQKPLCL